MLEAVKNGIAINVQDTLQNWLGALMDREEELKTLEKNKENERRQKLKVESPSATKETFKYSYPD